MNTTLTKIQLIPTGPSFISGYLDVDQRVPVPVNYAISDIRDPQKRTGSFSKTIILPGTKNNNRLLSQLFEVNVAEGTFSVKRLYRCLLLQDNVPLHENELSLQLLSVNKIQNQLTEDDQIEYEVVVRDDVAQFFAQVANRNLKDIDLTDLTHNINDATIISSFNHTWVDGYKYILPYKDDSTLYDFFEPIPGVYAKTYWDRLHADAGFSYQFFNNVEPQYFSKLIIPSNKSNDDQLQVTKEENKLIVSFPGTQQFSQVAIIPSGGVNYVIGPDNPGVFPPPPSPPSVWIYDIDYSQKIQDILNSFSLATDQWSPQLATSNNYRVRIQFDYWFEINNTYIAPIDIFTLASRGRAFNMEVQHRFDIVAGPGTGTSIGVTPVQTSLIQQNSTTPSITNVYSTYNVGISPGEDNQIQTYVHELVLPSTAIGQILESKLVFRTLDTLYSNDPYSLIFNIRNITLSIEIDSGTLILNQPINMNASTPDMKQADFLKSIYTMYNLYVVPDKNNSNKLIYYQRDDFYRNGKNVDWTSKMARDAEQKLEFLPELRNKELMLTYKQDDDVINEFYTNFTGEVYGQKSVTFDIEWTKGTDKKEISFSPTPGGLSNFGHYLPYIERENNPRILIDYGNLFTPNQIGIVSQYFLNIFPIPTFTSFYPFVSHLNAPINPTFDLNFGENPYYFYDILIPTLNNLYNQYWRNMVQLIDKGKLLTAYFFLEPTDIFNMELNDKIRIDNSYWNINKIIDYDAGDKRLTKVELITDSELLPFPIIEDGEPEEGGGEPGGE